MVAGLILALQPVAAMEQAIRVETPSAPLPGTPAIRPPMPPPVPRLAPREPTAPPRWQMVEEPVPSRWAGPDATGAAAGVPSPASTALSWELVVPVVGDSPEQPAAAEPQIAAEPTWELILPGEEITPADVARQVEAEEAARQEALAELEPQQPDLDAIQVMAMSRGITVNRKLYPDISLTVPNGFKRDPNHFLSLSLDGTNQVRRVDFKGCRGSSSCPDIEFNAELALLQTKTFSLELIYTVGNVVSDNNNPNAWEAQQLGFRIAGNITPTLGLAFGGESQLELDDGYLPVDNPGAQLKGRTLYAVASTAIPLATRENPPILTLSLGVGNGYYGFDGRNAGDDQWGPFGSISYAFNNRFGIAAEYSGYAFSAGISVRPIDQLPLTATLFVTDFLGNFPSGIEKSCFENSCSPRALGRLTYSF